MTTFPADNELCICGEPSCPGCTCGSGCPYAPGHSEGTHATEPLQSLIEAAEILIANMVEGGEAYDDHEQEETSGQLYPDVRRLNATIALAKKHLTWYGMPVYLVPYPDGSSRARAVHSMNEFSAAVRQLVALRFACPECHDDFQQALERGLASLVDFVGTTVDRLIPEPEEADKLLVFIAFNMDFFTTIPEYYAPENSFAPAAIAYYHLYQYTVGLIEDGLDEILHQAAQLLAERQRLQEQLTQANRCEVCGQEPCAWFWDPFALREGSPAMHALLCIQPEKSKVPVGVVAIGERCKQRLEEGETLSFTSGGQHYRQVDGTFERNGA